MRTVTPLVDAISLVFLQLSIIVSPGPRQSNNSSRQNQEYTQRQRNYIERKISNKQHNSQNHPEHSKYTNQIFPCRNTSHALTQSFQLLASEYIVYQ